MVSVPLNRFAAVRLVASICIILVSITPLFLGKNWWNILGVRTTIIGVTMFVGMLIVLQGVMWHVFFVKSLPIEEAKDG
jgi:membrane protein DedA with SNARE-associated domain